jgi:hypothetical protein
MAQSFVVDACAICYIFLLIYTVIQGIFYFEVLQKTSNSFSIDRKKINLRFILKKIL